MRFVTFLLAVIFASALGGALRAEPPVAFKEAPAKLPTLPPKIDMKVGELREFKVIGKGLGYEPAFDAKRCDLLRLHTDDVDTLAFVIRPKVEGSFPVVFWLPGEKRGAVLE